MRYFLEASGQSFYEENQILIGEIMLEAYRYQYILSGTGLPQFQAILSDLVIRQQFERICAALSTLQPARRWPIVDQLN